MPREKLGDTENINDNDITQFGEAITEKMNEYIRKSQAFKELQSEEVIE